MYNLSDYIISFDNILEDDFCKQLIDQFEGASERLYHSKRSWDIDEQSKEHKSTKEYRSFKELNISQDESFKWAHQKFYETSKMLAEEYKKRCKAIFFPKKFGLEDARMKKYDNDGFDQFGWHVDVGDHPSARRYLVIFYYLNDVEEGGETIFHLGDSKYATVNPKRGRMVMFPPMWMFPHTGTRPRSSPKYIISTYLHYLNGE